MFWHHFYDLCKITTKDKGPHISYYMNYTTEIFLRAYVRFRVYRRAY